MSNAPSTTRAILFDRDDTLIVDVPYSADPARVRPMPTAVQAVRRARAAGLRTGVVTNQSGIARGFFDEAALGRMHERVEDLFGGFDVWCVCPHGPGDGCACRKPRPGMVLQAAGELGLEPRDVTVVGDIGADVEAARAAGAQGILVPTPRTRRQEILAAPRVAADLDEAVALVAEGVPA